MIFVLILISDFLLYIVIQLIFVCLPCEMLNRNDERRHPCIVPDFRSNACSLSPLDMMFPLRFYKYSLSG